MKILVVFGTRPEAIKMAPVVKALAASETIHPVLCVTGQHRDMLAEILNFFELVPDHDLALMRPEQDLVYLAACGAFSRPKSPIGCWSTATRRRPWPPPSPGSMPGAASAMSRPACAPAICASPGPR